MAIIRNFRLPEGIGVSADYVETFGVIQSTSPNTGAVVSRGGVGVGNSISIGGRLQLFNGNYFAAFDFTGSASTVYILPSSSPATGSSVLQSTSAGVMSWVPMVPNYSVSSGTANTSTYSHQSGYAITSGSASIATTSTYAHQAGYAITAGSSSTWTTPRTLNLSGDLSGSVIWSGSGDTTLTATIVANSVTLGADTTGQYASTVSVSGSGITATASNADDSTAYTIYSSASASNTASSIVLRDGSGNFLAGNITANLTGTATTAQNINVANALSNSAHPLHFSPSAFGSGLATSSNTSLSYNPSTLVLSTSGLAITSGAASTNSTSGALVVTGGVGIGGSLYVAGDLTINGTTTTINSVTLTVDDKNIELGSVSTPSDVTAEGGGITLKGATDKSINWYTGTGWSSSESWNLASGSTYKINNTTVLSNSSLGTGVTNSSLTALGTIRTGVWAGTLITALYGGTGFNSYTKGDLLVGAGTTLIKHGVGSQNQILIADLFSGSGLSWATFANPTYGSFYSTSTQQVAGLGVSTPINFNATYESNRVSIFGGSGTSSRIQIQDAGPYSITFSAQINLVTGNSPSNGDFWFRVNGQDIPQSNSSMSISGKDYETLLTVNFVYTFANNDYFEIYMASLDTQFSIEYQSGLTNPPRPNTPSIILSVLPITHIVGASGSGISGILSLNGSNTSQQYFLTGTSGSNFNVSTVNGNHTFNIPIAGIGATGLVTGIAQTFEGSKTFSANTIITASTASTTTTTGALIVSGGVGIGQSVSVGGRLQLFNGANYTAFVSSATGNTVYTLPATSPATGTSYLSSNSAGIMSWAAPSSIGNTSGGITDGTVQYKFGSGFAGTSSFFYDTTLYALRLSNFPAGEATSSTSAALKVEQTTGSFNGSLNGTMIAVNVNNGFTGDLLNLQTNAITKFRIDANGAIGTSSDIVSVSTTAATNTTSGALQVKGGAGIAQSVFVGGNIVLTNNLYSGGNYFTKSGQAAGDIILDNNSNDTAGLLYYYKNNTNFGIDVFATGTGSTRFRIVKDLNESGGSELWSIDRAGVVTRTAWDVGEVINTRVYNNSDLGMSATTTINSTTYTNIAIITYTPKSSTSHLWIEFDANYDYSNGTTADDFFSRITVGGSVISEKNQIMIGQVGGGTRSGVIFPISGRYTNSSTSGIAITVQAKWGSADDAIRVYGSSTSGYMRIQEIGR
jgi:hypothetical protein